MLRKRNIKILKQRTSRKRNPPYKFRVRKKSICEYNVHSVFTNKKNFTKANLLEEITFVKASTNITSRG